MRLSRPPETQRTILRLVGRRYQRITDFGVGQTAGYTQQRAVQAPVMQRGRGCPEASGRRGQYYGVGTGGASRVRGECQVPRLL